MINIEILISQNMTDEERRWLLVEESDLLEFMSIGFRDNIYDAKVTKFFPPRAVDPSTIEMVMTLTELAADIGIFGLVFKQISKLVKKTKGYTVTIHVQKENDWSGENTTLIATAENVDIKDVEKVGVELKKQLETVMRDSE